MKLYRSTGGDDGTGDRTEQNTIPSFVSVFVIIERVRRREFSERGKERDQKQTHTHTPPWAHKLTTSEKLFFYVNKKTHATGAYGDHLPSCTHTQLLHATDPVRVHTVYSSRIIFDPSESRARFKCTIFFLVPESRLE